MKQKELSNSIAKLTENNKKLLEYVLEPILDEIAFSETCKVYLEHGGVVGRFIDYEKALTLLKKLEIIDDYRNTRFGKSVVDGTVYVKDKFEIKFVEKDLIDFADLLFKNDAVKTNENTETLALAKSKESTASLNQKIIVAPSSYDPVNGVLSIAGYNIPIIKQPSQKGILHESKQARIMRFLFKDVNTMRDGVPMRTILSVRASEFKPIHRKLVKSYVSEINKKLPQELLIKELITTNQYAVMVDSRYLK